MELLLFVCFTLAENLRIVKELTIEATIGRFQLIRGLQDDCVDFLPIDLFIVIILEKMSSFCFLFSNKKKNYADFSIVYRQFVCFKRNIFVNVAVQPSFII